MQATSRSNASTKQTATQKHIIFTFVKKGYAGDGSLCQLGNSLDNTNCRVAERFTFAAKRSIDSGYVNLDCIWLRINTD